MNHNSALAAALQASNDLAELRVQLEETRAALAAEQRARELAQAVCFACQEYRHQLRPSAVVAALEAWERGEG